MTVRASADSASTTVGGRVRLTLDVQDAAGWTVTPPSPGAELGSFLVRTVTPRTDADRTVFDLALVPTEPGDLEIPPVTLAAKTPAGKDTTLASNGVRVLVRSNLTGEEVSADSASASAQPADYKPALEAPRDWAPVWIALVSLAVALAAGFYLARRLRRMRRRPVAVPPPPAVERKRLRPAWEIALEELDRIVQADHVGRGELGVQYVEVTEALRRYLENRYGVPALESTTDELAPRLEPLGLDADLRARIVAVLREADLVKFAKARPEAPLARAIEVRARELVRETTPHVSSNPVGAAP
jgi:hypothetical protein